MGKLQGKASWYTPWKKQWEVHYNIQVKPGTPAARHGDRPPARGLDQRTLAHRSRANGRESDGPGWRARRVEAWAGSRGWEEAAPRTVYRTSRGTPPIGDSLGTSRDFQVCPRDIPGTFRRVNREGPDSPEGNERAGQDLPPQLDGVHRQAPRAVSLYFSDMSAAFDHGAELRICSGMGRLESRRGLFGDFLTQGCLQGIRRGVTWRWEWVSWFGAGVRSLRRPSQCIGRRFMICCQRPIARL
jgi:hypothetical protein